MQKVRLKDVAQTAGTSECTASRVLNKRMLDRISKDTQQRVYQAAEKLGYSANPIARAMRTQRTMTVGVSLKNLREGIAATLADELEWYAQQHGFDLFIGVERDEPLAELHRLRQREVDGLILVRSTTVYDPHQILAALRKEHFPLVCIGPAPFSGIASVDWDRHTGVRKMTADLTKCGASRLLLIGTIDSPGMKQRENGFREAVSEVSNITAETFYLVNSQEEARLLKADKASDLLNTKLQKFKPDTVIVQSSKLARKISELAHRLNWNIPADLKLAVASSMNNPDWENPPITTLEPDVALMAETTIKTLGHFITKRGQNPIQSRSIQMVEPKICWRKSCNSQSTGIS